jgi:4'-phosphopantetheinyl transferase
VELAGASAEFQRAWSLLSAEERAAAERFRRERDREAFVRMRAALRERLGELVGGAAGELVFLRGPQGKPELARPWADRGWRFNVSHSGGLGLMAFAQACPVGVDIEQHRADLEYLDLARRFFSPQEQAELRALSPAVQLGAFFDCWTRKEAFLKALGQGLSLPLDSFAVSLAPGQPARLLSATSAWGLTAAWQMADLRPRAGYSAALVWAAEPPASVQSRAR